MKKVETNLNRRWEDGTPHHPKSLALYAALAKIDYKHNNDYFNWKCGGDGDNGEELMYELDIIFETEDAVGADDAERSKKESAFIAMSRMDIPKKKKKRKA